LPYRFVAKAFTPVGFIFYIKIESLFAFRVENIVDTENKNMKYRTLHHIKI
jgi:hypothetical protein